MAQTRHAYGHRRSRKIRLKKILKPRYFNVKVNVTLSDTKDQTEGLPQGSVISLKFFILKINKIVPEMSRENRFQISLYDENLQISYRHPDRRMLRESSRTV